MVYLIAGLLTLLALAVVSWPFFKPPETVPAEPASADARDLLVQKETLYAAIKELDFDYESGKLAIEDYQQARRGYELQAVDVLREIDRLAEPRTDPRAGSLQEQDR
jgi:hypothetical protein